MIAPSRQTAIYERMKLLPTCPVSSLAKVASGRGEIATYIYNLKKRPYTVRIMTKDSTVMSRLPISVTAHSGMLSQKPQSLMVCTMLSGR